MRQHGHSWLEEDEGDFLPLLGRAFIEADVKAFKAGRKISFPSFFGRAIIEAGSGPRSSARREYFPSFFGGAFIEASDQHHEPHQLPSFSFWEGLSLR